MEDLLGFDTEDESEDAPDSNVPAVRGDRFEIDHFVDPKKLIRFMNTTRRLPLEAVDDYIVNKTYPAAVWLFRSAAVSGQINATRSMKMWLDWATPIINASKRKRKDPPKSPGSVAFLPREPKPGDERKDESE
jgi:hypothetical protein